MTTFRRRLTAGESATVRSGTSPIFAVLGGRGTAEPALLARAWELLALEHPILRSRIVEDDSEYVVTIDDAAPPLTEPPSDDGRLDKIIHRRWNVGDPVAQAILVQDGNTCMIIVALHHALADGRLTVTLLHKLARYYTLMTEGNPPRPIPRQFFELPLEQRLAQFRNSAWAEQPSPAIGVRRLPRPEASARESAEFEIQNLRFSQAETTRVEAIARKWRISVNSLLSASALAALRSLFDPPHQIPLGIGYPIDLRNRIHPPLPPEAELCCVAAWSVILPLAAQFDVIECSGTIQEVLDKAIATEAPQSAMAHGVSDTWRTNSISMSNLGRLELPPAPTGLTFENTRFMVASPVPHPAIFVTTTAGRLNLDVIHNRDIVSDQDGKCLVERIDRTIRTLPSL
ncbi:condensation domain-containing protein [Nocardia sp. NPDC088792]|uniref:phthiocerol/phthiodiolone dimycocerosyl transferase family protein n=1 Tax=Nocardia sp. NPDC088792 TaxID=3364332 RepID=UPI0037FB939B